MPLGRVDAQGDRPLAGGLDPHADGSVAFDLYDGHGSIAVGAKLAGAGGAVDARGVADSDAAYLAQVGAARLAVGDAPRVVVNDRDQGTRPHLHLGGGGGRRAERGGRREDRGRGAPCGHVGWEVGRIRISLTST